jgi:hypothetical protein
MSIMPRHHWSCFPFSLSLIQILAMWWRRRWSLIRKHDSINLLILLQKKILFSFSALVMGNIRPYPCRDPHFVVGTCRWRQFFFVRLGHGGVHDGWPRTARGLHAALELAVSSKLFAKLYGLFDSNATVALLLLLCNVKVVSPTIAPVQPRAMEELGCAVTMLLH